MDHKTAVSLAVSAAALALAAAGCGGSGDSDSSSSSSSGSSGSNANPTLEQAVKYAQCMRANGVANWPDPDKDGRFVIAAGGPDRTTPQFKKAQQACKSLAPPGIKDDPAEVAKEQKEWLKAAQCMRRNGVPNFPDPQGGRLKVDRNKIDVNSPQFKKALQLCRRAANPGGGSGGSG